MAASEGEADTFIALSADPDVVTLTPFTAVYSPAVSVTLHDDMHNHPGYEPGPKGARMGYHELDGRG
jgi:hypothetical protein